MKTIKKLSYGLATAIAVTMVAVGAHAQTGAPAAGAATKAPAATAKMPPPPAATAKAPPAAAGKVEALKKADDKKVEAKKTVTDKKAAASKKSACAGLEQAACTTNASCQWIAAVKRKDGRENRAHCRTSAAAAKASVKK